jgi:5-amino-6-(5-phospho-D-ribitylamino)uracil phosphatase
VTVTEVTVLTLAMVEDATRAISDDAELSIGISMVVSDLDGTLLNAQGALSPRTVNAVRRLRASGVHFVIATARPLRDVMGVAEALSVDGPVICQNGAVVAQGAKRGAEFIGWLMGSVLQRDVVRRAREAFPDCSIAVDYPHHRLADPQWPGPYGRGPVHYSLWPLTGGELPRRRAACVMIRDAWDDPGVLEDEFPVTVTTSSPKLLEVSRKGVDKAFAMIRICRMLEISPDTVISFGDMPNDISMLARSALGVAVANAPESVRMRADRVTGSNDDEGVAEMIELLLRHEDDHDQEA